MKLKKLTTADLLQEFAAAALGSRLSTARENRTYAALTELSKRFTQEEHCQLRDNWIHFRDVHMSYRSILCDRVKSLKEKYND